MKNKILKLDNQELRQDIINFITKIGYNMQYIKNKHNISDDTIKYLTSFVKGQEGFLFSRIGKENKNYSDFETNFETYSKLKKIQLVKKYNCTYTTIMCFFYYYAGKTNNLTKK